VDEGPYELGEVALAPGDVVVDAGANMGAFSALASWLECDVYSFEAIPFVVERYLKRTAALHPRISIVPCALWSCEETLTFSAATDDTDENSLGSSSAVLSLESPGFVKAAVPAIPLDLFVERNGLERVDFIKADIEGAEREMLKGARDTLRRFAPKLSICTYHLSDDPQILRQLILEANPQYVVWQKKYKLYAHVPCGGREPKRQAQPENRHPY
jgi:FkbM family methyltransferase